MLKYLLAAVVMFAGLIDGFDVTEPNKELAGRTTQNAVAALPAAIGDASDEPPVDVRVWYFNPDGSCVQCSFGMHGVVCNVIEASTLLWDTPYGRAERGGSWPSRVADYCNSRGIDAYNVTGSGTWDWIKYAAITGRGCAIGADTRHFQYCSSYDGEYWYVCDNRTPKRIDRYTEDEFRKLHLKSGQWTIVLDCPAPPAPPKYVRWW